MLQTEGVELDEESAELFEKVRPGEGDEFMAVKPWLGAIKEPTPKPKVDPSKPKAEYEIDWVYGYRSEEARMNLFFNDQGEAVYPTALSSLSIPHSVPTGLAVSSVSVSGAGSHHDSVSALSTVSSASFWIS